MMWIVQLLITIGAALFVGAVSLIVRTAIKTIAARRDLERRGRGLKVVDKFSIWAGHVNSHFFREAQMCSWEHLTRKLGAKTVSLLYGSKKFALSADLNLIKQMVLDRRETGRTVLVSPFKELEVDCILTAGGDQWRRIRRAMAPALESDKFRTPTVQRDIESSINKLVRAIESKFDTTKRIEIELDISDYAHRYSLDLVLSCFLRQNNRIDFEAEVEPMTQMVDSISRTVMRSQLVRLGIVFPILKSTLSWLMKRLYREQTLWRRNLMSMIKQQVELNFRAHEHLEELKRMGKLSASEEEETLFVLGDGVEFRRNLMDQVIDQVYEGKLTEREHCHSSYFLIEVANKTSAVAIAHTLYQLATHLDIQSKLRKSILTEGTGSRYLSWVIDESLRLLPPAPMGCSRMASRDYKCADGIVPEGTFVVTSVYSIHRLEEYWGPDAQEFRPERFAKSKHFHPMQFMPFGRGARECPGKGFALHEMKRLLCVLMRRYKFRSEPTEVKYGTPFFMFQLPNKHFRVKVLRV